MADVTGAGPVHAIGEAALVTATLILSVLAGQSAGLVALRLEREA